MIPTNIVWKTNYQSGISFLLPGKICFEPQISPKTEWFFGRCQPKVIWQNINVKYKFSKNTCNLFIHESKSWWCTIKHFTSQKWMMCWSNRTGIFFLWIYTRYILSISILFLWPEFSSYGRNLSSLKCSSSNTLHKFPFKEHFFSCIRNYFSVAGIY